MPDHHYHNSLGLAIIQARWFPQLLRLPPPVHGASGSRAPAQRLYKTNVSPDRDGRLAGKSRDFLTVTDFGGTSSMARKTRLLAELHHSRTARIRVAGGGAEGDAPDAPASALGLPHGQPQPPKPLFSIRRHRAKKPPESVGWGNEALPKHERLEPQSDPSGARRSRREFQVGPSVASMPIQDRLNLWIN